MTSKFVWACFEELVHFILKHGCFKLSNNRKKKKKKIHKVPWTNIFSQSELPHPCMFPTCTSYLGDTRIFLPLIKKNWDLSCSGNAADFPTKTQMYLSARHSYTRNVVPTLKCWILEFWTTKNRLSPCGKHWSHLPKLCFQITSTNPRFQ